MLALFSIRRQNWNRKILNIYLLGDMASEGIRKYVDEYFEKVH
jgi:hypothetical protein